MVSVSKAPRAAGKLGVNFQNPSMAEDSITKSPKLLSFPSNIDNFPSDGSSIHTIQIYSTETMDIVGGALAAGQKAYSEFRETLSSVATTVSNLTSNENVVNTADDVNLITERFDRISNGTNRLRNVFTFYMPQPIIFPLSNEYKELSLTESIGGAIGAFVTSALNVGNALDGAIGTGLLASQRLGYPINPKIEILYVNTPQRKFEFNFAFSPESPAEAASLKEMIKRIRYDASPERKTNGLFWKAPNTFDILFMHNGKENENIPKLTQCVLEDMEVNYTPSSVGWTTFTNGFPISTTMRLAFRELEPIDRANIDRGF